MHSSECTWLLLLVWVDAMHRPKLHAKTHTCAPPLAPLTMHLCMCCERFYVQRRIKKRGHNARGRRRKEERLSNPRPTALPCTTTWFENHPPPHPQRMPTAFYGRSKPVRSDMRCGGVLWNGKFCIHVLCVIERGGRLYFALRRPWQHVLCLGTY